jgi:hypothetical protein
VKPRRLEARPDIFPQPAKERKCYGFVWRSSRRW